MATSVTDEELDTLRSDVEKLRQEVAEAQMTEAARVREQENSVYAAQLEAEKARLETELLVAKNNAKVSTVKTGVSSLVDRSKEQTRAARAQARELQKQLDKDGNKASDKASDKADGESSDANTEK